MPTNSKIIPHQHLYRCLGKAINVRRKRLGLTQQDLANESGVDRAFISNLEQGKRNPSFGIVVNIAKGLNLRYSRLVANCEQCVSEEKAG
jgi:transcriptional regulator with XRE-family HTH domain